jgi:hypothetical protein
MRRILAIALLLILSFPVLSPLFSASAGGGVMPACCRRDGKHHCMMLDMQASDSNTHIITSIQARCPYFPSSVQTTPFHTDPPHLTAANSLPFPAGLALTIAENEARYRISSERARHKRGPPVMLLSLL